MQVEDTRYLGIAAAKIKLGDIFFESYLYFNSTRCVVLDIFWVAFRGYSRMFDQSRVLNRYRYQKL
jgi:hypothetical protein